MKTYRWPVNWVGRFPTVDDALGGASSCFIARSKSIDPWEDFSCKGIMCGDCPFDSDNIVDDMEGIINSAIKNLGAI